MEPTLPGLQGIKGCVQYMASRPHKPIFYPSSYYDGSNITSSSWSGNQVKDHAAQNCMGCHQYMDHDIIINMRRSVSGIIHTLLSVDVCLKVQIQLAIASNSTDEEIRCM